MTVREHILGALMGAAYGDAMGMPSEFFSRKQVKEKFGTIRGLLPGHPDSPISSSFMAGDVTDDTLTTLMVCEMLLANKGQVNPADFVERLSAWAGGQGKSKQVIGPSTRAALEKIRSGMEMAEAGKSGITNGAAMRVPPLGMVWDGHSLEQLTEQVRLLCLPTHNTGPAIAGACAVAAAVGLAVAGETSLSKVIETAVMAARLGESLGYPAVSPSVAERILFAVELARSEGNEQDRLDRIYNLVGTGLPIADSVPAAFAVLSLSEGDPAQCALLAANLGGDTDTIGSMATAVCGALHGPQAFPAEQIARIEQVNQIDFHAYARALEEVRHSGTSERKPVEPMPEA